MTRLIYTHKKGELREARKKRSKNKNYQEARRLDAAAKQTQASASQTAGEQPTLRKPNVPERR